PSRGIARQHSDRNLARSLRMPFRKSAGIEHAFDRLRRRKDSGGRELVFLGDRNDLANRFRPLLGRDRGGLIEVSRRERRSARSGTRRNRQQVGIRLLHLSQAFGGVYYTLQAFIVELVGRRARGTSIESRANGDHEILVCQILMDGVVREASQRIAVS